MKKALLILLCLFIFLQISFAQERQDETIQSAKSNSQIPTKEEVFELIQSNPADRVVVITTTNADGSVHASVVGIWVHDGVIKFRASSEIAIARNLQRSRGAVITLYKIPEKGVPLNKHKGARVWVKLIENKERKQALNEGKSLKSIYALEVVKIKSLQENDDYIKVKGKINE